MSTQPARGIHTHPDFRLGRRAPKRAPALELTRWLTGEVPEHPVSGSNFGKAKFGLYENNRFGDCGPTAVANLIRLVSKGLTGKQVSPTQAQVFDLYRRSGNPGFDPRSGADDNGVDMQTMLEALLADGIGDVKPIAFARVNATDDAELDAAVAIFGGVLLGVNLETPQQRQTQTHPPLWDYATPHNEWGGHAVLAGLWNETTGVDAVISWRLQVQISAMFRERQVQEAWVVVFDWHLGSKQFEAGIDQAAMRADFTALTGDAIP